MVGKTTKKRILAIFVIFALAAIFLAIGLGLGLRDTDDDDDSDASSGGSKPTQPPLTKDDEITLLIMLDGFMPSYLTQEIAPTLYQLANNGVKGKIMPAFPSVTYPNFVTILTGAYPEYHNIIANSFYNPELQDTFIFGTQGAFHPKWWSVPTIWINANESGVKSGMANWLAPPNALPNFFRPYEPVQFNHIPRIDEAIGWLNLSRTERPRFVGIYFQQPDDTSHIKGPTANETLAITTEMDKAVKYLLDKLDDINVRNITNIIVISDHGMAEVNCTARGVDLQPMTNFANTIFISSSEIALLYTNSQAKKDEVLQDLTCKQQYLYAYGKSTHTMPIRMHFQNSRTIPDVVITPRGDYLLANNISTCVPYLGNHGYDNIQPNMQAVFVANGPAFQKGITDIHFPNIELFNLFSDLLGIQAAPNNGTYGSLHFIMKPEYRKSIPMPQMFTFNNRSFPSNFSQAVDACTNCQCQDCNATQQDIEVYQKSLNLSDAEVSQSQSKHFPWWLPMSYKRNDDVIILTQKDFVVGCSKSMKIPLFEGHMLSKSSLNGQSSFKRCFHKDIRLSNNESSTCSQYQQSGFLRQPLAPIGDLPGGLDVNLFNTDLLSNVVPMYPNFADMNAPQLSSARTGAWIKLEEWVRTRRFTNLYVMSGAIFDMNSDGLADTMEQQKKWLKNDNSTIPIPTHYYKVLIKCSVNVAIDQCAVDKLDTLAFVLPHTNDTLCSLRNMADYLGQHVARLRDVELLTGLHFFSKLPAADQARLKVQQHRAEEWPEQVNNQVA